MLININIFLFLLLPFSLIFSSFVADFTISLMGLSFLLYSILNKDFKFLKNPIFIILIFWCLYVLFLSLFSENIFHSLESSLFYVRFVLFAFSISFFLNRNNNLLNYFTYSFLLAFSLLIADSYFQFYMGFNFFGYEYDQNNLFGSRLSSFFADESILGSFIIRLLPFLLFLIIYTNIFKKYTSLFIIFFFPLLESIVLISGERTALLFVIFYNCIFFIFSKYSKVLFLKSMLSFTLIFLLLLSFADLRKRVISYTFFQFNDLQQHLLINDSKNNDKEITINSSDEDNLIQIDNNTNDNFQLKKIISLDFLTKLPFFTLQHQLVYETSLKIFRDNIYFGVGPKMFRIICKNDKYKVYSKIDETVTGCQTHPHNTYLQLLVETGIFGFILFIFIFSFIFYKVFLQNIYNKIVRNNYYHDPQLSLLFCFIITLWPLIPSGNFFHNWLNIIYIMPLGFLIYINNAKEE